MKCEDVIETLTAHGDDQDSIAYRHAEQHLQRCELCRSAALAVSALRDEARASVPRPGRGSFARAVRAAAAAAEESRRPVPGRRQFWRGAAAGGALAAGLALALVLVWPPARTPAPAGTPTVTARMNVVRSVDIELASPAHLEDAEIRLVLDGAIELEGYEGYRELAWHTDLDAGTNQLSLPVIVRGPAGGRLHVVVRMGQRERSFSVDVRTDAVPGEPVGRRVGTDSSVGRV